MSWSELIDNGQGNIPWANLVVNSISSSNISSDGKLTVTNDTSSGTDNIKLNQIVPSVANDIGFYTNNVSNGYIGYNSIVNQLYVLSTNAITFITNGLERIKIPVNGIILDNASPNVLASTGGNMVYKTNVADSTNTLTLSNKTLDSSNTYGNMIVNLGSGPLTQVFYNTVVVPANGGAVSIGIINLANNQCVSINILMSAKILTGANTGYGNYIIDFKAVNNGGTMISSAGNNNTKSEANIVGTFVNRITYSLNATLPTINFQINNPITTGPVTITTQITTIIS
jgi:hypothetical protein